MRAISLIALFLAGFFFHSMGSICVETSPWSVDTRDGLSIRTNPVADFSVSTTQTKVTFPIVFTNLSLNNPTQFFWDFGDGTNDTVANPIHAYQAPGIYTVMLVVSDGVATDTMTVQDLMHISPRSPQFEWAQNVGGNVVNMSWAKLTTDKNGNIFKAGTFNQTVDFDPGPGVNSLTAIGDDDVYICKNSSNGTLIWAKHYGNLQYLTVDAITADSLGNIYVAGLFEETLDVNPGPQIFELTSLGGADIYIVKLNSSGGFVWAKSFGVANPIGSSSERIYSLAIDNAGNILAAGKFIGTLDCDPNSGAFNITSLGQTDAFICKLTANGNFVWAGSMGGASSDEGIDICVDQTGNIYTSGTFEATADLDPTSSVLSTISAGNSDIFLNKLSPTGAQIWTKTWGHSLIEEVIGLAVDPMGNIYTFGTFYDSLDCDPGSGIYNVYGSWFDELFLLKLNTSGNFEWAKSMGGSMFTYGRDVSTDMDGNVYVTGDFPFSFHLNPVTPGLELTSNGGNDIFIMCLNPNGNIYWQESIGATSSENCFKVSVSNDGSIYYRGEFTQTVDFDFGTGTSYLTSDIYADNFTLKISPPVTMEIDFMASDTSLVVGETVLFTNQCTGSPTSYQWNFGDGTTSTFTNPSHQYIQTGTYTVSLIASNSQVSAAEIKTLYVSVGTELEVDQTLAQINCFGENNGTITINVTNGTSPYSYSWSNGNSTNSQTNLSPGMYWLTLTDYYANSYQGNFEITQPDTLELAGLITDSACLGAIEISASGGVPPYSYLWSTGDTTPDISGIAANQYFLSVSDIHNCIVTDSFELVMAQLPLDISPSHTNVTCNGYADGTIDVLITGGATPYILMWSNGSTDNNLSNLEPGEYGLSIIDQNNCTRDITILLTEPPLLTATTLVTNVVGTGNSNGAIQTTPNGGIPPYQFSWNTGANTGLLENIPAGNYSLTITDANQCTWDSAFVVNETIGIAEKIDTPTIKIYPNPANDKLYIDLPMKSECDFQSRPDWQPRIELINTTGQVVFEKEISNRQKLEFDISHLPAGEYFVLVIVDGKQVFVEKVVKE